MSDIYAYIWHETLNLDLMRKLLGFLCVCALAIVTARAQDAVDDYVSSAAGQSKYDLQFKIGNVFCTNGKEIGVFGTRGP